MIRWDNRIKTTSPFVHYANPFCKEIYSVFRITIREYNPLTYKEFTDESGEKSGRFMTKAEVWAEEQSHNALLCQCGCGQRIIIQWRHRYRGIPEYLPYHQPDFQKSKQPEAES